MSACIIDECQSAPIYDGCCETHLWEIEHTSTYMGGPHVKPEEDCPFCEAAS